MKNNKGLFAGIAAVLAVVIIGALLMGGSKKDSTATQSSSSSSSMAMPDSTNKPAGNSMQTVEASDVMISDYMYKPGAIKVKVGTKVTWTNMDNVKHNVVPDQDSADFKAGPLIAKGETYSYTFMKAGTYTYHCDPHPYMKASVVVTE
ncbi:MAG: plastocyanin/azurin family copper-binding protein [Patescibacteria group bacterium]|nr:plastocyanin/azurin family copper-binding protein [Patescibacteria group bacterium]